MKKYVLGLDGGGTKTHCALFDTSGKEVDFLEWGTTNHECMAGGFNELKKELTCLLDAILVKNGIGAEQLVKCVFGMAGVDTRKQHSLISRIISKYGIKDFILCNDSFLGIKAGSELGYGICAINGTGYSVTGMDPAGAMLQVGGMGSYTDDSGGGCYLVNRAVGSIYSSLYKGADKTIMQQMLFELLGITAREDFLEAVTEKLHACSKEYFQKIGRLVYEAANKGDITAINILKDIGRDYARGIVSVYRELNFKSMDKIEIILAGTQFTRCENPTTINIIQNILNSEMVGVDFQIKPLDKPCVMGAISWALHDTLEG